MADVDTSLSAATETTAVDGRTARRQRNIDAVIDVVLDLFAEESLLPSIEQAAQRSGLSLRSLYRYFADPAELIEATVKRSNERAEPLAHLSAIGEGPLDRRIRDFVDMRLRVYNEAIPVYRATVANAPHLQAMADELAKTRNRLRTQFERQFEPELSTRTRAGRRALLGAGDVLTQLDAIDMLRRHRGLSEAEVKADLTTVLRSLLTDSP